jgi:hypothetical protein
MTSRTIPFLSSSNYLKYQLHTLDVLQQLVSAPEVLGVPFGFENISNYIGQHSLSFPWPFPLLFPDVLRLLLDEAVSSRCDGCIVNLVLVFGGGQLFDIAEEKVIQIVAYLYLDLVLRLAGIILGHDVATVQFFEKILHLFFAFGVANMVLNGELLHSKFLIDLHG